MMKLAQLTVLATAGLLTASLAMADEKVAATVNGVAIPQSLVDLRVKLSGQPDSPDLRKMIRDQLINIELVSQAAKKSGLDKQADVVQMMELAKQDALANAFVQDYIKNHPIGEDAIKKEYDGLKTQHALPEYKVSHILVESEKDAKAIEAQLKKKAKFEDLATQKSQDAMSARQGGALGWTAPINFVQPFSAALLKLKKGQVSAPVKTDYGWHIIRLDDTRDITLEQAKPELIQRLQQQAIQKYVGDLRGSAKIE